MSDNTPPTPKKPGQRTTTPLLSAEEYMARTGTSLFAWPTSPTPPRPVKGGEYQPTQDDDKDTPSPDT